MSIRASNPHSPTVDADWSTISQEMGDGGQMDYDMFASRWEAEDNIQDPKKQTLHNLIHDFDEDGLTIKVHGEKPEVKGQSGKSALDTTAERGAQNTDMA